MSLTLLEKQGSTQYPRNGALLNYHALGRQSGRLYGCNLVQATSETIVLTSGVLAVRGYRIDVVDEIVFDASQAVAPAEPMRYHIIIRLDAGTEDTEMELIVTDEGPINETAIEEQNGMYDYLIGVFNFGPGGISELTCLVDTIKDKKPVFPAELNGVGWFDGALVDGTEPPIFCDKSLIEGIDLGDYYLNSETGNYYKCIDITDTYAFWEYRGNIKGPQGQKGDPGDGQDLSEYYKKIETYSSVEIDAMFDNLLGGEY